MTIHQDAYVFAGLFDGAERAEHWVGNGRRAYVHLVRGEATVNGRALNAGDAIKLSDVESVTIENGRDAEVLFFDLP